MATTKSNVKEAPSKSASKSTSAKSTASKSTEDKNKETKSTASKSTATKSTASKSTSARSAAAKSNPVRKSSGSKSSGMMTTDHDEIKKWAESRNGKPSRVASTGKNDTGILRFDFPGYSGKDSLQEISWDEFFKKFDDSNLQFLYQDKTSTGKQSRFNKFVSKDN